MKSLLHGLAATALLMCGLVPVAMAQTTGLLEIDFTNVALPLSSWLTALIAVLVGVSGIYAQRRIGRRARHAMWAVLGIGAVALAAFTLNLRPFSDAQATSGTPLYLGVSPVFAPVSFNGSDFLVINGTSGPVMLTAVQVDGASGLNPGATTCVVGLSLPSGASCFVSVPSVL